MTEDLPAMDRVVIWKAADGWRWHRLDGSNGNVIAESGEAYERRDHTERMAYRVNAGDFVLELASD